MKLSYCFNEGFAKLEIDGIPDSSLGHNPETLGIILSWKLQLIGYTQLEGKKDHLYSLIEAVSKYARYSISGIKRSIGIETSLISIIPIENSHQLVLRSTKEGVQPLKILLDDAEFCDLARCLDQVIYSTNVAINFTPTDNVPLTKSEFNRPFFSFYNLIIPFMAGMSFVSLSIIFLLIPFSANSPQLPKLYESAPPSATDQNK